jgi:hypothetical protein
MGAWTGIVSARPFRISAGPIDLAGKWSVAKDSCDPGYVGQTGTIVWVKRKAGSFKMTIAGQAASGVLAGRAVTLTYVDPKTGRVESILSGSVAGSGARLAITLQAHCLSGGGGTITFAWDGSSPCSGACRFAGRVKLGGLIFEVLSVSLGPGAGISTTKPSSTATRRVEVHVVVPVSGVSPKLQRAAASSRSFGTMTLQLFKTGTTTVKRTYTFTNVEIAEVMGAGGSGGSVQDVTFRGDE